ncbi:MAG: hypothetical protein ABW124_15635 [Candidatus Thiodiazotropha sp. 6PLUC9]
MLCSKPHSVFIRILTTSLLTALLSSGCGGGGGGGGDNTTPDSDSGTTEDNVDSDDTQPDTQSGYRVLRRQYDFDLNGVIDGVSEFVYDTNGRLMEEQYTYTDDGTPDIRLLGSTLPRENLNTTATYTYDTDGRVETWSETNSEYSFTTTYTYNTSGLISRVDTTSLDSIGGVTTQVHHLLEYDGIRLIEHTHHLNNNPVANQTYQIEYNSDGRVSTNNMAVNPPGSDSLFSYTYFSNGNTETVIATTPSTPSIGDMVYNFAFNSANQPTSFEFRSDLDQYTDDFSYTYRYADNALLSESLVDRYLDGSTDVRIITEWEAGVCTPMILWGVRAIVPTNSDPSSPYIPGTGYWESDFCATAGE